MNSQLEMKWSWIEPTHDIRNQLLAALTDADLAYSPGGDNPTLGVLFREVGEVEHSYLESFKTFSQSFDYRHPEPKIASSVSRLQAWFAEMDADMKATLEAFSESDLDKQINRASGFQMPVSMQVDVYLQALLIFLGKAAVYFRAAAKPLPEGFVDWIG
jgi:hypothetical protein